MDDDEPYSPGGSDEDDLILPKIAPVPSFLSTTAAPQKSENQIQREVEELNRQIEAEKKQIAEITNNEIGDLSGGGHLAPVWDTFGRYGETAADTIDEPYSPTSAVSPQINTNLSDVVSKISLPPNLADILQNVSQIQI